MLAVISYSLLSSVFSEDCFRKVFKANEKASSKFARLEDELLWKARSVQMQTSRSCR